MLGAPNRAAIPRLSIGFLAIVLALGIYLPMFGLSVIAVFVLERIVLSRIPVLREWLGLREPGPQSP